MCPSKHSEQLVRERLPDLGDSFKIQHHTLKPLESMRDSFGLGARDELLPLVLRQAYRHHSLVKRVLLFVGELVENRLQGSGAVVCDAHHDQRSRCVGGSFGQEVKRLSVVPKMQMA